MATTSVGFSHPALGEEVKARVAVTSVRSALGSKASG